MKAGKNMRLAVVLLMSMLLITGCWDKIEIEDRLFVLAIGVDSVKEEERTNSEDRYTFSFAAPVAAKVKEGSGPSFSTYKTMGNSIIMSLSQLLERFSQKQFFGHTRAIFFGEDIMKDEQLLKEAVDGITRYHELHKSIYAYVVPGRAEEVFKVKPVYEKLFAPYISGVTENNIYDSKIVKLSLSEMIIGLVEQNGGLVIPRLIPDKDEVKVNGAGVVKNYKLIDYLEGQEAETYNWLINKAKGGDISIVHDGAVVAFRHFTFKRNIKLTKVEGGKIYLNYKMETEGSVEEYTMNKKLLDNALLEKLESELKKKIESESGKLIKKFQKEYRIDLIGAKDYLSKYQPNLFKTIEKDYDRYFTDKIEIEVTADVHIRRVGLTK